MSNSLTILSDTVLFSLLVSLFSMGLSAASQEGALLYPLRLFMEGLFSQRLEQKLHVIENYAKYRRASYRQPSAWIGVVIDKIRWSIFLRNLWHKPLLTCSMCMPSVWGTTIFWLLPYEHHKLYIWLIGIPIASAIVILTKKLR